VQLVKEGALHEAFDKLELRGMRHKLIVFRDLVTLLEAGPRSNGEHDAYVRTERENGADASDSTGRSSAGWKFGGRRNATGHRRREEDS
jgi:hypothetical protein